jgi:hypothetical protein
MPARPDEENSGWASKRTQHFNIKKINWLRLFKEIIPVYTENHTKPTNKNAASLILKSDCTLVTTRLQRPKHEI